MTNRSLLITAVTAALLAPASAAHATGATCDGLAATIVSGKSVIRGTSGSDVIRVTGKRAHRVYGLAGNDVICGSAGADVIYGGAGNDVILGGDGKDRLFGNAGADALFGGKSVDALFGGTGSDDLDGNDKGDTLAGGSGTDVLHMDTYDHVVGAAGDDEQDDSEWLTLSAGEAALKVVLQTAGQALYDGLTAATVTGSGNQATLPVDATVTPYSLATDQLALIRNVTWRTAALGEDEDNGPRGCVDGIAADSGRSFKVRIEARDGHDSDEQDESTTPTGPQLRFTLGTCEFTWDHDHEGD